MQKIVPHLWFDKEAGQAARFYTSIFADSSIKSSSILDDTPSGSVEMLTISLSGQDFMLISAGPLFKFTPAVSFLVGCRTKEEVSTLWSKLREGGTDLMPLGSYPFSESYGWLVDKYGLSWQIMYQGESMVGRKITPTLMYVGAMAGKAEEALGLYTSIFPDGKIGDLFRYGGDAAPDREGTIAHGAFSLAGLGFAAMDSAQAHDFAFTEAISFLVRCDSQAEIDRYWEALSFVPEAEACGWLKDKFGLSWQIVPSRMEEMMASGSPAQTAKVTEAFLKMKKFDIAILEKAYADAAP